MLNNMQSCDTTANTLKSPSTLVVKLIFSGSLLMVGSSTQTATISALYLVPPLRPITLKALVEWVVAASLMELLLLCKDLNSFNMHFNNRTFKLVLSHEQGIAWYP